MKIKQFDVVELNNDDTAIIKKINKDNSYLVQIISNKTMQSTITNKEIKKVVYSKESER